MTIRDDDRAEAERLKLVSRQDQLAILDLHRSVANNRKLSAEERSEARRKLQSLTRLLGIRRTK
jgi:hypothetical protein